MEVEKINIDGTIYDVADAVARAAINSVNSLVNRRFIVIGDSYAVGVISTDNEYTPIGWTGHLQRLLNKSDTDFVKSIQSRTGFIGADSVTFLDLLNSANASNPDTITDIVVCGGYNDRPHSVNNLVLAITEFLRRAKTLYPNATVHVGMCGAFTGSDFNIKNQLNNTVLPAYTLSTTVELSNISNFSYIAGIENVVKENTTYMSGDNIHPNDFGYNSIALQILAHLNGGTRRACAPYTAISGDNMVGSGTITVFKVIANNIAKVCVSGFTTPFAATSKSNITLFSADNAKELNSGPVQLCSQTVTGTITAGGNIYPLNAFVFISGGSLKMTINNPEFIASDITSISVTQPVCFDIPLILY